MSTTTGATAPHPMPARIPSTVRTAPPSRERAEEPSGFDALEVDLEQTAVLLQLAQLAQLPPEELCGRDLLSRLVTVAGRALPTADWCSIALGDPRAPRDAAADSRTAQLADGLQSRAGEGPGVDAFAHGVPVLVQHVGQDHRWPRLSVLSGALPVRAGLSVPITVNAVPNGTLNGEVIGVLSYHGAQPGAFDSADDLDLGLTVTAAAATVLGARAQVEALQQEVQNLRTAMTSRASIEQAKGMVAAWLSCGLEEAFEVMSRLSQDRNVKLRDLAALLVRDPLSTGLRELLVTYRASSPRPRSRGPRG
ncbi:GAF and ANTAR domain-containing protein [Kineococcus sp. GCM10028916]|uniref:GAF and ANTAR domain-containing protein n=1 Tax=Kineococcus sp. GCM10028916 TaxID=3273394 RepID=UPI00364095B6